MGSGSSIDNEECSSSELLISGYFKLISIHYGAGLVIPTDILGLCVKFYKIDIVQLFMLTNMIDPDYKKTKTSNGIKCIDFNGRKIIRFSVYDINNPKKLTTTHELWECMKGGICVAKNVNLPSFIVNKHNKILTSTFFDIDKNSKSKKKKSHKRHSFKKTNLESMNIFFKIGGNYPNYSSKGYEYTDKCLAVIFDSKQIDWLRIPTNGFQNIDTLQLDLPLLPNQCTSTCIYSQKYHKLISIMDNYAANIYQLSFNQNQDNECINNWKWNIMTKLENNNYSFNQPSLCFINDGNELMVVGGIEDHYQLVNLYNLENKKWTKIKEMNYTRCGCGIFYDNKFSKNVFVGGGLFSTINGKSKGTRIVEQYDFNKNKWFCLPQTKIEHNYFPPLWIDENVGKNILFIAGFRPNDIGMIEFYDLRTNNKQWTEANKYVQHNIRNAIPKNSVLERLFTVSC